MSAALRELAVCDAPARRFMVSIWSADGSRRDFERVGGCSVDHVLEAIDGVSADDEQGARIKVRQLVDGGARD